MAEFSIWVAGFGDIKLWHAQFWSKSYFYWRNEHEYSRKVNPRLKVGLSKFKGLKARPRIPQSGSRIPQSASRIPQSGPRVPQSVLGVVTYAFRFGFRFLYLQEPEIWRWANMGGWMRLQLCLWWWTPRPLQMYRQVSSQTPPYSPFTTNCVYWNIYTPINVVATITLHWWVSWFKNLLNQWLCSISIFTGTSPEYWPPYISFLSLNWIMISQ